MATDKKTDRKTSGAGSAKTKPEGNDIKKAKATVKRKAKRSMKRHPWIWTIAILAILAAIFILTPTQNPLDTTLSFQSDGGIDEELALPAYSKTDIVVQHTGYTLCYSEEDEQPYWVAYVLTADEVFADNAQRADNFHEDPSIPTGSATLADYRGSGYDRGHMIPAADLKWSEQSMDDSFFMSNMSPQVGALNRGVWADLESVVRTFAAQNQAICVVTGPVLTDGPYKKIGSNGVSVPNYYYKAILDYTGPEHKAIGFLLANEGSKEDLETFAVTIDELEEMTGLDFFPRLPDDEEAVLESSFDVDLWDFTQFNASKIAAKYGYDLETGSYDFSKATVAASNAQPSTPQEQVLYFLYTNFGQYKIAIISTFEGLFADAKALATSLF